MGEAGSSTSRPIMAILGLSAASYDMPPKVQKGDLAMTGLRIDRGAEHLEDGPICALCLAVRPRVKRRGPRFI